MLEAPLISGQSQTDYDPPRFSGDQAQTVTMVPEQLCHLVLDQPTEAMVAAEGSHRSSHVLVFRVQRAEAEPGQPKVLQERGTRGSGQPSPEGASATHLSAPHLPATLKASQEPTLPVAHITWVLWGSGSLQRAQHGNRGDRPAGAPLFG